MIKILLIYIALQWLKLHWYTLHFYTLGGWQVFTLHWWNELAGNSATQFNLCARQKCLATFSKVLISLELAKHFVQGLHCDCGAESSFQCLWLKTGRDKSVALRHTHNTAMHCTALMTDLKINAPQKSAVSDLHWYRLFAKAMQEGNEQNILQILSLLYSKINGCSSKNSSNALTS